MARRLVSAWIAAALTATCALARADEPAAPTPASGAATAPAYTLDVTSDAPGVVSYDALADRLEIELGANVARAGGKAATRAAITVRFVAGTLTIRATYEGGRVLERSVHAEGDDAAVRNEAVLLAANVARDEARELLDALAARARPAAPVRSASPAPPKADEPPHPPEIDVVASAALAYPLATNVGHPNATSHVDLSLLYGRVGKVLGLQVGPGIVHASRGLEGAQISGLSSIALADARGVQISGAANVIDGRLQGAALTGGANIVTGDVTGAEIAIVNTARDVDGIQLGIVNVARNVRGVQIGIVNVADEVDGAAIGLVSVSRNSVHPLVWASSASYTNIGVKFATKYVYTIAALTFGNPELAWKPQIGSFFALGAHVPLPMHLDAELEGGYANVSTTDALTAPGNTAPTQNTWVHTRAVVGYAFAEHLRIFAGAGAQIPVDIAVGRAITRPEVLGGVQF